MSYSNLLQKRIGERDDRIAELEAEIDNYQEQLESAEADAAILSPLPCEVFGEGLAWLHTAAEAAKENE